MFFGEKNMLHVDRYTDHSIFAIIWNITLCMKSGIIYGMNNDQQV